MYPIRTRLLLAVLGAFTLLAPVATAGQRDQKTIFTFSGPVEVPGQTLPGGTYVFKLVDSPANRHIVRIFNKDESEVLGTFLAIPDYRLRPAGKTIITFSERPAGSPPAVRGWFYPGRSYGHEFVYPKPKAVALAQANNVPVPAMPAELTADITRPAVTMHETTVMALMVAPLRAEEPNGQEAGIADAFPQPPAPLPDRLPATASPLPLIGLLGLGALAGFGVLRTIPARTKC